MARADEGGRVEDPQLHRRLRMVKAAFLLVALSAACGSLHGSRRPTGPAADATITLYRDGAFVEEDVVVDVAAGEGSARLPRPAGVDVGALMIDSEDVLVHGWTAVEKADERAIVVDVAA